MFTLLFAAAFAVAQSSVAPAVPASPAPASAAIVIPAGTKVPLHISQPISSHDAHTGQTFTFYVAQDVLVNGTVVIPRCAAGAGTVTLAGKHGINGHEGNLRLRFDTVTASDGSSVALTRDEQAFNGKNRKALAFFTTRWINGDDVVVKPDTQLTAVVAKDTALVSGHDPVATCVSPGASPAASPTATP